MVNTKIFFILFALFPAYAYAGQSETITISAVVPPSRYVIVDKALHIQKITSNSPLTTQPTIKLNSIDGPSIAWNLDVERQYNNLTPTLDFSRPGIIYNRTQPRSILATTIFAVRQLLSNLI